MLLSRPVQLADYLEREGLSAEVFAEHLGITAEAVRLYLRAKRTPRRAVMNRIVELTNGLVRPNDFFAAPTAKRPRRARAEGHKIEAA